MEYVNNTDILCLLFYSVIATDIYQHFLFVQNDGERLHLYLIFTVFSSCPQGVFPLSTKLRLAAGTLKPIAEI